MMDGCCLKSEINANVGQQKSFIAEAAGFFCLFVFAGALHKLD